MQQKIILGFVLVIALIGALILGINIGSADYEQIAIYASIGVAIYFVSYGWRNVWWFVALLIFSGAVFSQGFDFDARHLFALMIVLASGLAFLYGHRAGPQTLAFRQAGSKQTTILLGLLLLYAGFHFAVYYVFPYSPTDYAIKSSLKAYFQAFAPIFCCFWLLSGSYKFRLKPDWSRMLIVIIFICLLANIAVLAVMFHLGYQNIEGVEVSPRDYMLYVPVINMQPSIYTLRNLCPVATALVLMIATSRGWWKETGKIMRLIVLMTLPAILVGSVYSGGRATTIFCLAIAVFVAFARRKIHLVAVMVCMAIFVIAGVNVFSHEINTKAPLSISRSLQLVMIEKDQTSYGSVTHSQDSRNAAFKEALVQWQADNRVFFFGRSVYSVTQKDMLTVRYDALDEFVENAMRTGGTHNLLTDLLLQYGLVGCALYLLAYLSVIRFVWRLTLTIPDSEPLAKSLAGAMKIYLPLMLAYQLLGGTFLPMEVALVIGLVRALLYQSSSAVEKQPTAAISRFNDRIQNRPPPIQASN